MTSLPAATQAIINGNTTVLANMCLPSIINDLYENRSLLYLACQKGRVEIVKLLLGVSGIDVNKGVSILSYLNYNI